MSSHWAKSDDEDPFGRDFDDDDDAINFDAGSNSYSGSNNSAGADEAYMEEILASDELLISDSGSDTDAEVKKDGVEALDTPNSLILEVSDSDDSAAREISAQAARSPGISAKVGPGLEKLSDLSIKSVKSAVPPGEPSQLRLSFQKADAELRFCPIPPLQAAQRKNASCDVHFHRAANRLRLHGEYYDGATNVATQTKEMSMVTESKAQIAFMQLYPTPENYKPPPVPSRQPSLDVAMEKARKETPFAAGNRIGPKIKKFSSKKRILPPLKEDFYKEELFWTGSRFCGEYKGKQFYKGRYDHPTGVIYESEWMDGQFQNNKHKNIVIYPRGDSFEGTWENGVYIDGSVVFGDGLRYSPENWSYCNGTDRRFKIEKYYGMKPAGATIHSQNYPEKILKPGYYDTGEGMYDPVKNEIKTYEGFFKRIPDETEKEWILANCRKEHGPEEEYFPHFHPDRLPGHSMEPYLKRHISTDEFVMDIHVGHHKHHHGKTNEELS